MHTCYAPILPFICSEHACHCDLMIECRVPHEPPELVLAASTAALRDPTLPGPRQPPDGNGHPLGGLARGGAVGMDMAVGGRRPPETQQASGTIQALPFHDRVRGRRMAHVFQPRVRHGPGLQPVGRCSHTAETRTGLPADSSRRPRAKAQSEQVAQQFMTAVCAARLP